MVVLASFRSEPPPPPREKRSISGTDPHPCLWQLTFPNVKNPPPKKKTVDFGHTFPKSRTPPPPPPPLQSILAPLTFPNVKAGDAFKKTLTFLCFCACRRCSWHSGRSTVPKSTFFFWGTFGKVNGAKMTVFFFGGGGGVLDIREGRRCQNRPFFLGGEGGWSTVPKSTVFFLGIGASWH